MFLQGSASLKFTWVNSLAIMTDGAAKKYKLAVGTIFRNEAHCLDEWIQHYAMRGADKFYLINDDSTDDYLTVLEPYLKSGLVTLIDTNWQRYTGRQRDIYTHYFLPLFESAEWFIICDMDEFIWSPRSTDLPRLLAENFQHIAVIQIRHTVFGSNGHIAQPSSIVAGFTRRTADSPSSMSHNEKCIYNTRHKFTYLNVHYPTFADPEDKARRFVQFPDWWRMNHYSCQSWDFWNCVKCARGDADQYRVRTPDRGFAQYDQNDVVDDLLWKQTQALLLGAGSNHFL